MSELNSYRGDDAEMNAAIEEAQRRLPEFRRALESDARRAIPTIEGALVKARFESLITGEPEHIWLEDAGFEGDNIVGTIANEPKNIPELDKGERVLSRPMPSPTGSIGKVSGLLEDSQSV